VEENWAEVHRAANNSKFRQTGSLTLESLCGNQNYVHQSRQAQWTVSHSAMDKRIAFNFLSSTESNFFLWPTFCFGCPLLANAAQCSALTEQCSRLVAQSWAWHRDKLVQVTGQSLLMFGLLHWCWNLVLRVLLTVAWVPPMNLCKLRWHTNAEWLNGYSQCTSQQKMALDASSWIRQSPST